MSTQTLLLSVFKYKAWANEGLFTELAKVDAVARQSERHSVIRLLNHIYIVDRIFAAHLSGEMPGYTGINTPETPTIEELRSAVVKSDRWYVEYIGKLAAERFSESIQFTFTDGVSGCMSREEMLAHVATHGDYHRGAIGLLLPQASVHPFTVYLHKAESR